MEDKTFLNDGDKNIFTLKTDSKEQETVRNFLKEKNIKELDILLIDGNHALNGVTNDFLYTDLLKVGGHILFHDTNYHFGPKSLVDAIDLKYYEVEKYFEKPEDVDWGMTLAKKIK